MLKTFACFIPLLLALFTPSISIAKLAISPTQLRLDRNFKSATLQIKNDSKKEATYQVSLMTWKRVNGEDVYEKTNDMLITPPIFTIKPQIEQKIRFIPTFKEESEHERRYIVKIKEIRKFEGITDSNVKLNFLFQLIIPVFIKPENMVKLHSGNIAVSHEKGTVIVHNKSNRHINVVSIITDKHTNTKKDMVENIFPGEKKKFNAAELKDYAVEIKDYGALQIIEPAAPVEYNTNSHSHF